jgi:hypothetical protein
MAAKELIFAVLTVPIILIISVAVFQNFFSSSQSTFEQTTTNETLGTISSSPITFSTAYPSKVDSLTAYAKNITSGATVSISTSVDYKSGLEPAAVTITSATTGTDIKAYANYTAYAKEGYSSYTKTYTGTFSGFNLGALLPFILIAVTIVGIIVGALAWKS